MWKNKNKAIMAGEVFVYITAVIVFAVVLIFGYRAITGFLEKGEKVAYVTFKTDLEKAIREVYTDYGSVVVYNQKNPLAAPAQYKEICFVDLDKPALSPSDSFCRNKTIVCNAWRDAGGWEEGDQNVFLEPMGLSPIKVVRITVDTDGNGQETAQDLGYLCLPVTQGRVDMRLAGKGNRTFISR